MKRRAIYRISAYIYMIWLLFSAAFPCCAAEIGAGAVPVEEERPAVTSVSISPGTVVVSKNTTCAFTASVAGAGNYSRDVAWSVSGQSSGNTFIDGNGVLNVASDETASSLVIRAVSKQDSNYSATALAYVQASTYNIQVQASPENGGDVYGGGSVQEDGYVVLSASPKEGFTFEGWLLNNNRVSQDARYVVDHIHGDAVYVAEFKPVECRITVSVNDNNAGTATESRTVKYGEGVTLEAFSKEGYQFDSWTENGNTVSRNSRMQIDKVTGNRTYTAVFKKKEAQSYTITASVSSSNGTITPEGKTTVKEGAAVIYTITPKTGYDIRMVYVDGAEVGKTASFNFSDVRGDHTISADFVEAPKRDDPEAAKTDQTKQDNKKNETDQQSGKDKTDDSDDPQKKQQEDERKKEEKEKKDEELPEETTQTGELQITIHNDFADGRQENFGISGLESAARQLLSGEEERLMLQGDLPVLIDLSIKDMEGKVSQETKDAFEEKKLPSMTIGRYFEITLREKKGNEKQNVSELSEQIKMVIHVPEPLQAQDRTFYILSLYTKADGSPEFVHLVDEDENPDTITFSTDHFSSCAIAYIDFQKENKEKPEEAQGQNNRMKTVAAAVVVVMALIVTATGIWYIVGRKRS